jgi:acid phosphatase (class A)
MTLMLRAIPVWLFVFAIWSAVQAAPVFLSPADLDPKLMLPAPPKEGSAAANAELAELDRIQSQRTPEEFARADRDFKTRNGSIFAEAVGPAFDLGKLPATAKLLDDVGKDEDTEATIAKDYFQRKRPWLVDGNLKSCSQADTPLSSYPSGHSTMGYAMGVVLANLIPAKGPVIMARAADYAENRLICGMHRRRDIQAGQVLGTVVAEILLHKPAFQPEYQAAKHELAAAGLAP